MINSERGLFVIHILVLLTVVKETPVSVRKNSSLSWVEQILRNRRFLKLQKIDLEYERV